MIKPALDKPVIIGKFTGVHGVAGWLKVMPYTQNIMDAVEYQPWYIEMDGRTIPLYVLAFKRYKNTGLLVQIEDYTDRDQARHLVNHTFAVDRADFPPLEEGHYWVDLLGLTVVSSQGITLGKIADIFEGPAHSIIVVEEGKHSHLIPFVKGSIVKDINLEQGIMTVEWEE